MECIFCKIIAREIPAEIVFENDEILAFKDVQPKAPIHILIIPKKHIESTSRLEEQDQAVTGKMIYRAKLITESLQIAEKGYKLLIRTGKDGGQEVPHIHLHLMGGKKLD